MKDASHLTGQAQWPTPRKSEYKDSGPKGSKSQIHMSDRHYLCAKVLDEQDGLPAQDSPSTNGKNQELWLTPRSNEPDENRKAFVDRNADRGEHCHGSLTTQAKENWRTPTEGEASRNMDYANQNYLKRQVKGKLNPAWVEQLMGLQVGWTQIKE
jgi:hypothetical protein